MAAEEESADGKAPSRSAAASSGSSSGSGSGNGSDEKDGASGDGGGTAWSGFGDYMESMGSRMDGKGDGANFEAMIEAALAKEAAEGKKKADEYKHAEQVGLDEAKEEREDRLEEKTPDDGDERTQPPSSVRRRCRPPLPPLAFGRCWIYHSYGGDGVGGSKDTSISTSSTGGGRGVDMGDESGLVQLDGLGDWYRRLYLGWSRLARKATSYE